MSGPRGRETAAGVNLLHVGPWKPGRTDGLPVEGVVETGGAARRVISDQRVVEFIIQTWDFLS